jgi:hypothetical protein
MPDMREDLRHVCDVIRGDFVVKNPIAPPSAVDEYISADFLKALRKHLGI